MAPPKTQEHIVDRTPEYDEFINNLKLFHEKRGTNFDPEPKMGNIIVDLLKLFNYVVEQGGYDKVSEEKLMWRKVCETLNLMRTSAPADAYSLKQIFYKNLAAYEIKTIHNKEPPPPEILEFTTAKGGGLLTRTLENYAGKSKLTGHRDSEASGDDGTPARDRPGGSDTPGSGRAARGLREAPPQRVIFQPDTSTRSTRHASNQHSNSNTHTPTQASHHPSNSHHHHQPHPPHPHTPGPMATGHPYQQPIRGASHIYNPQEADLQVQSIMSWDSQRSDPLQLGIADTPSSNPQLFASRQRALRRQLIGDPPAVLWRYHLPTSNIDGPNIYERCLLSLRSNIAAEQAFALNHLVKISFERGDKYKFTQFPGLAEGLTEKALEVGSLFYEVNWSISYDPYVDEGAIDELDGINGTSDILQRIDQLKPKLIHDTMQTGEFTDQMVLVTEAILTIRNMAMLQENAFYLADFMPLKDLVCIVLNLPNKDVVVEIKHFALDIAEQITPCLSLSPSDPLYKTLLEQLQSKDRGTILTALRALGRIAMNKEETNKLSSVPREALRNITDWLLLNDDELMDACLDFLYQYTAVVSNLDTLVEAIRIDHLVSHLIRLLSHGAKRVQKELTISQEDPHVYDQPSEEVHHIPRDLLEELVATEEPERCYAWLRCLFEEDAESHITQIAIWQAYNTAFLEPLKKSNKSMINAAEFIRNISQVYSSAGAQIVRDRGPDGNEVQRFIIKGIRPRSRPVSTDNREYFRCSWTRVPGRPVKCGAWFLTADKMGEHILEDHLKETRDEENKFKNREDMFTCQWGNCTKYPKPTQLNLFGFANHIKIHVKNEERKANPPHGSEFPPQSSSGSGKRASKSRSSKPAKTISLTFEETAAVRDERNPAAPPQAVGIPLSAVLILRNIARNISRTDAEGTLAKDQAEHGGYQERLFRSAMPRLTEIMTENRALAPHITSLLLLLSRPSSLEA
ncbi:hypothetical protein GQ53DRAFT_679690 [Thozetella sp. PMI_491]|nr:hypothetical protein GQ53DRAFT_679690 [Thozetella sp. PMI_491]